MDTYINIDDISKKILDSAKLLQTVKVHALIVGNKGVGKKSLAKYILNNSPLFKAKQLQNDISDEILELRNCSIIVDEIQELTNIDLFLQYIEDNNIRIIALGSSETLNQKLEELFSITLLIEDLKNRPLDTNKLSEKFSKEASSILDMPLINTNKLIKNISNNSHSLRKSIFFSYLFETIGEKEIIMFLEKYFQDNLEGETSYKDFLPLFEVPLLKAANKKYKSQVQVSKHLGLNRITLRKKLELHKEVL